MGETKARGKRPRGRPPTRTDEESRHIIAQAAWREFMSNGYASTCVDDVAKAAGVSKRTLYRLIPAKADLFKISVSDRIARFMLAVDKRKIGSLDLFDALERLLAEYGNLTLSRETIAMQKLVIAESDRFPELAANFYAEAILTTQARLANFLIRQCALGLVELDGPQAAAGMLCGMMILEPQRAVMMGRAALPSEAEIAQRARICARIFLRGCLKGRARSAAQ